MGKIYEVNGAAIIQVGTGVSQALVDLGVSVDGVMIDQEIIRIPFHSDAFGGPEGIPAGHQYMGEFAHIRAELIYWDNDEFNRIWASKIDGTPGLALAMGTLLNTHTGASRHTHRLAIKSPTIGATAGYDYVAAFLRRSPRKVGTRVTRIQCEWYAWNFDADNATPGTWFDRSIA